MSFIVRSLRTLNSAWQHGKNSFITTSKYLNNNIIRLFDSCWVINVVSYSNREGRGNAHLTGDYKRISDVVVRNFDAVTTEYYLKYVEAHPVILDRLEQTILKDSRFAQVVRDFESQKVCYLPLTTLIVKPLHRILHYDLLLERKWNKCYNEWFKKLNNTS